MKAYTKMKNSPWWW